MEKQTKERAMHRARIIAGQVRGLEDCIKREKYCIDIIHQSLAIREALSSLENLMLENHVKTHVAEQIRAGKKEKAAKEIVSVYRLAKRK